MRPLKQLRAGFILATILIYSTLLTSCNIVSKDDTLFESINGQSLFNEEINPEGSTSETGFDATLEEVLHLISDYGYEPTYPSIFGRNTGTEIANAMDLARGGQHLSIPTTYPTGAWYHYTDSTCNYSCQITEYIYWGLTTYLGAQDYPGRAEEISNEWEITTSENLQTRDTTLYAILTNTAYNLPKILPTGDYPTTNVTVNFTIESSLPNELSELNDKFSKYISIFGIHILGTTQVEETKFLHAASVLAEYLDDDQDGTVNDSDMVNHLVSNKAAMIITYDENELESLLD